MRHSQRQHFLREGAPTPGTESLRPKNKMGWGFISLKHRLHRCSHVRLDAGGEVALASGRHLVRTPAPTAKPQGSYVRVRVSPPRLQIGRFRRRILPALHAIHRGEGVLTGLACVRCTISAGAPTQHRAAQLVACSPPPVSPPTAQSRARNLAGCTPLAVGQGQAHRPG